MGLLLRLDGLPSPKSSLSLPFSTAISASLSLAFSSSSSSLLSVDVFVSLWASLSTYVSLLVLFSVSLSYILLLFVWWLLSVGSSPVSIGESVDDWEREEERGAEEVETGEVVEGRGGVVVRMGDAAEEIGKVEGGVGAVGGGMKRIGRSKRIRPPLPNLARPRKGVDVRDVAICPSIRRGKNYTKGSRKSKAGKYELK